LKFYFKYNDVFLVCIPLGQVDNRTRRHDPVSRTVRHGDAAFARRRTVPWPVSGMMSFFYSPNIS